MKHYIKTDNVTAKPMTVKEFYEQTHQSQFQEMIENGEGDKEGYFVEYHEDVVPYWIPKARFEKQYKVADTPLDRMAIEIEDLTDKSMKLHKFINSNTFMEFDSETRALLEAQLYIMEDYKQLLSARADKMKEQPAEKKERSLGFSFAVADTFLRGGFVVRRGSWDKGVVVIKQVPARISQDIIPNMQSLPTEAKNLILKNTGFIYYQNQCLIYDVNIGVADSWSPSADDIFACDWEVVTE